MSQVDDVRIRRAGGLEDYEACVTLQQAVPQAAPSEDIVGLTFLVAGNSYGGSLLLAEEADGQLAGFSFALLCRTPEDGGLFWWSQLTLVAREAQGKDVHFQLKLAQRKDALENGIHEIRWTVDPLRATSAHLNLRKLGAVSHVLEENAYGFPPNPLERALPTDRLHVEWHLNSNRVTNRLSGSAGLIFRDLDGLIRVFEVHEGSPGPPDLTFEESLLLLEIPTDFEAVKEANLASAWQDILRKTFHHYFEQGYAVTDFMMVDKPRPKAFYVLEKTE